MKTLLSNSYVIFKPYLPNQMWDIWACQREAKTTRVYSLQLFQELRNPILTLQYSIFMNIIIATLCYSVFTFSFFSLLLKYTYLIYFAYGGNTWYTIVHITPQKYVTFYKERSATMDLTRQQFDFQWVCICISPRWNSWWMLLTFPCSPN